MTKTIFVTEGTAGCGEYIARALADAGHTVYVGKGQDEIQAKRVNTGSADNTEAGHNGLRTIAFEALDQHSIAAAVRAIADEAGAIDVVVYTSSPVTYGPVESFTPYQLSQVYDMGVLSVQRITRAVLPGMRERRDGLLIWIGTNVDRGPAPFTGPGHAVGAALRQLATSYAAELAAFGIDATFLTHSPVQAQDTPTVSALQPGDSDIAQAYGQVIKDEGTPLEQRSPKFAAHAKRVAECVSSLVDAPQGARPTHVRL